jgi:hypothetical protein
MTLGRGASGATAAVVVRGSVVPIASEYVTVILRLVLDHSGRVLRGELVDVERGSQGRFVGRLGLARALRAWLASRTARVESPGDSRE